MKFKALFASTLLVAVLTKMSLLAECTSKIELSPAYVHLDILESGHTLSSKDLFAIRADGSFRILDGLCLKASMLASCNPTDLVTGSFGLGHYTPITDTLCVTPSAGFTFTYLRATVEYEVPFLPEKLAFKEHFHSAAPYLALDISWTFCPKWRICGSYQYSWSHTNVTIEHQGKEKSHTQGPTYGLVLERDINDCLSVSIGGAYNISLSKEKHGLRGAGAKVGLAYWY